MLSITVAPTAIPASSPTCKVNMVTFNIEIDILKKKMLIWQTYGTGVGGNGGNDEEKIKSNEEFECESLSMADGGDSHATRHEGMEDSL